MDTQTPPLEEPKQKKYAWRSETLDLLDECQRLGAHKSETATIKAALEVYRGLLLRARQESAEWRRVQTARAVKR